MSLQEYINEQGYNTNNWFLEFTNEVSQQQRIMDIIKKKEYLAGSHKINNRPPEMFNGKPFEPRRIVLNYGARLIEYATSYLVGNGITYSGDQDIVTEIQRVYKNGFEQIDFDIVQSVYAYGNAYEYVYIKDGKIRSKMIDCADSYPVIDNDGEYVGFVESYTTNNVTFWNVHDGVTVTKYSNAGGELQLRGRFTSISGLPVLYRNENPLDSTFGRSDLDDYVGILDNMEDLISKSTDAFYKHVTGIPIIKGQKLKGDDTLPTEVVGGGLTLDSDSEFYFANNEFNHDSFKTLYSHLMMSLMDVSGTPSVAMGKVDVSNLSEISLKLLFSVANLKAMITERYIKEGLKSRLESIRKLLEIQGKKFTEEQWDSINITFQYAMPTSESDIIDNLKVLKEIGGLSLESLLKHNPYVTDVTSELERLSGEKIDSGQGNES
jgi:SPP1 family phage portal protein